MPEIGRTPLVPLTVPLDTGRVRLWLKLEGANRYGSVKARTANALLDSLDRAGLLRPGSTVVESTSGNLGVALAGLCRRRGLGCVLVVDADTPHGSRARMSEYGAEVIAVETPPDGNAVRRRLETVQRLLAERVGTVWTDQYGNRANPEVHRRWTAPELVAGLPPGVVLSAVAAVVSTGGTLAGLSAFLREHHPGTGVIGVDAVGSAATGGPRRPRPFKVPGFGSGRPSDFVRPADYDTVIRLDDAHAALACRVLAKATGLALGGSAGGAVLGALVAALADARLSDVGVICADLGAAYRDSVYAADRAWPPPDDPLVVAALEGLAQSERGQ